MSNNDISSFDEDLAENTGTAENIEFECDDDNSRLDSLVACKCEITRSAASKLIEDGLVSINGKVTPKKSFKAKLGNAICVVLPPPKLCKAIPQDIPLDIVYEDEEMLVVNKPQGMVVHPAPGNYDNTLVNALMFHCKGSLSSINGVIRPGIVHRIDKDTSGLLAVAKTDEAHKALSEQIKAHSFERVYNAIICGSMKQDSGTIDLPIGRNPVYRKKMAVSNTLSRPAVTHYKTLESFCGFSLLELRLETGRTHQIRVHLSHLGHPVAGDPIYGANNGKNPFGLCGQALHAKKLGIVHPKSGKYMEFESPLPRHFNKALSILSDKYSQA